MPAIGISVVIPAYGRLELLRRLLESLAPERRGSEPASEVIVADSSPEGLRGSVERLCLEFSARYLRSSSANPAVSRNAGARAARFPVVLFVDSDCRALPGLLRAHAGAYAGERTGGAAGVTEFEGPAGPGYVMMRGTPYLRPFSMASSGEPLSWAPSSNVSYRRDLLSAVGGFNEKLPVKAGGEDVLLGLAVTGAGYLIAGVPGAVVTHSSSTWNPPLAALARAVKWGRADCHIVSLFPGAARRDVRAGALALLASAALAPVLALLAGGAWLFLPAAALCCALAYRAAFGTPAREGRGAALSRLGGSLLMLAFETAYLAESLRRDPSVLFLAPGHPSGVRAPR